MEFELHAEFAAWIDRESADIAGRVRDLTHEFPRSSGSLHSDLPIIKVGPEQIVGEVAVSITDVTGKLSARYFPRNAQNAEQKKHHGGDVAIAAMAVRSPTARDAMLSPAKQNQKGKYPLRNSSRGTCIWGRDQSKLAGSRAGSPVLRIGVVRAGRI